jgi:hypothetical protein
MTNPDIAHHAHISPATISNLAAGRTHSMNRAAATAILNVQPATSQHGWIDATGTTRRLQALARLGHDSATLAPLLGVNPRRVERLRRGEKPVVHATVAARVDQTYRALNMTPRTGWQADRARNIATRKGWQPPLAWDDGNGPHGIDNPNATPAPAGRGQSLDDYLWLAENGTPLADITTRCDVTRDAIYKALRRAGRLDLWQRITRTEAA